MKVGILTFHSCINYGSYWQTRCLAERLKHWGHTPVVLNHYSKKVNIAEWKCALQPVLPTPVPGSDHALYRQKIEKFFDAIALLPLSKAFQLDDPKQLEEFDVVIVGSDEVWNFSHPWYAYFPLFFGEGIRAGKLISYAASFGSYNAAFQFDHEWLNKLLKFDELSVRDENSKLIIKRALDWEPAIVLDPCLLFPVMLNNFCDIKNFERPYTAIYGHNFSQKFINQIKLWSIERKIHLISIGYRNDWADEQWISADPTEFVSFINGSESVVTNFFHGCIFALITSKPFICETSDYRSNKVEDLLNKIGAENRLIEMSTATDKGVHILSEPLNDQILRNISFYQDFSETWLIQALR